jgi:hypothetical protein
VIQSYLITFATIMDLIFANKNQDISASFPQRLWLNSPTILTLSREDISERRPVGEVL